MNSLLTIKHPHPLMIFEIPTNSSGEWLKQARSAICCTNHFIYLVSKNRTSLLYSLFHQPRLYRHAVSPVGGL